MTFEDKMLLSLFILNNLFTVHGDDDTVSVIELESAAIGFMDQELKWIANRSL